MNASKFYRLAVVASLSVLILSACSTSKRAQRTDSPKTITVNEPSKTEPVFAEPEPSPPTMPATKAPWYESESIVLICSDPVSIDGPIREIADHIEDQELWYSRANATDCSGIFHIVLDSLENRCSNYDYPPFESYRTSRLLGKWYHEKGDFVRVTDPLNMDHYIKPGAVMFYGPRDISVSNVPTQDLFKQGGINHVGVVVDVKRDEQGKVTSYSLFHGQYAQTYASTTNWHKRENRNATYPPYGNGTEQWVGVAPIVSN